MANVRQHRRTDSDGCSCQSTGSEESCSLTDDYPSDTTTSSTRSSLPPGGGVNGGGGGGGGRGAPHTVLSGWNFYSSHHQSRTPHKNRNHHSQERVNGGGKPVHHRRCSSGSSSNHSKRLDSGYTGSLHEGGATTGRTPTTETTATLNEPFFLHEPNMTSDDRVKKLFDNKLKKEETAENNVNNNVANNNNANGAQIVTVEVHHSSASEDSNSVSDVSDPIPDYDDQGSQSSSTLGNNNTTTHRSKKASREVSSLSTDEGIYHGEEEEEDEELEDDLDDELVPNHHHHEDEEDDEDELHDNEVSFSPHHQEDLVAIRNKRPPPESGGGYPNALSRRTSSDAAHEDIGRKTVVENNSSQIRTLTRAQPKKTVEVAVSHPPPPPPPLPTKRTVTEETKVVKPPSPPPLPNSKKTEEDVGRPKAPPPPPPPDLPLKIKTSDHHEDDSASQKSDESGDGSTSESGKRFVKSTAARRNSHQRTLPFIPPQFSFPPDTNENIRPSEYLRQAKGSSSKHSTLKSSLHRAVSMGELANASSKPEKMSFGNRTESHETLLDSDSSSRSRFVQSPINGEELKSHPPLTSTNSNKSDTPLFNITVEQLQTVCLKKTDKPVTPERTVLLQKNDLIAELKQTKDIQGVRKMKEERSKIEVIEITQNYKAENFVDQIPEVDANGCVIPPWKRQMLAKKAAEKAKKEAEEQRIRDAEAKKLNSIPPWKRQLLQKKDPPSPVSMHSVHRTISTPVGKTPEPTIQPPPFIQEAVQNEQNRPPPPPEQPATNGTTSPDVYNEDPEDIPPNPWLQQLRKTKSVFR